MKSDKKKKKSRDPESQFPVVGIGASAGGLSPFKKLLKAISEESGMAYLFVQHLDPEHESLLPDILQKETKMPVVELSEESVIEPNHVYVMPSNKLMSVSDGKLRLTKRPKKKKSERVLPIDLLFSALAEVYESRAIGVVLSGTASDGTKGLKAIKDGGGITFAQNVESAEYDGMPGSAIQARVVDFVLPPEEIPKKLLEIKHFIKTGNALDTPGEKKDEGDFMQIITLLRVRKGTDFTYYKQTTIRRRILRRMAINKIKKVSAYLEYLRENKEEQDTLYSDFLIPVTSFFRDPKIFENLANKFLPDLIDKIPDDQTIRVWVAGCSTGEEAYSLAILFRELLETRTVGKPGKKVQIFASDLSESAIDKARLGIYSTSDLAGVSEKRIKKYFAKSNGNYQVNRQVRDMCVFAVHNFLKDPPFGKIDLISCRNVLIYFEPYLQKKALTTFHYVLNPNGLLLLGKSETTSGVPDLFSEAAKNDKIYTRKEASSKFVQVVNRRSELDYNQRTKSEIPEKKSPDFQRTADEYMLRNYTPPGVVVNEVMDIVQYRGKTGPYLEQSSGKPSHNLMTLAVPGLAFELRNVLHKAKQGHEEVRKEDIPVKLNDELHTISIEAIPLANTIEPHFLVLFHDTSSEKNRQGPESEGAEKGEVQDADKNLRIQQLEQELVDTREDMRNITEDQEVAIEELQSANEELMSSSEELQSLNEELETSKEELQSTNEELIVLNQEMSSLNEQIEAERNYSESIVANIREPLLVLDKNLRVRTVNNAFYKQFKLKEEETVGSLIYELGGKMWDFPEIKKLLEDVLSDNPVVTDYEVNHTFPGLGELHMLLNAREVAKDDESENLILLSVEDITEQVKEIEKRREIQEQYTKELEEKIEERTVELKNAIEELREMNMELVEMNKELEAFTYVSSHDLQEPLRKIQTFAGLVLEKENQNLSNKGKTYFNVMQGAANRMQKLIDDLLVFSRLNTSERVFESVDLQTIVEEVVANFSDVIKEKEANIELQEMCEADVIVFQFRQLMHNLISNALKFSKSGEKPHIKIKSRMVKGSELKEKGLSADQKYCHISVSDNGIGFDGKFNEKIFEVFQKLHSKDEYPGTGIGLATVKKIVTHHHGEIFVDSTLNKGTTFDIYFPKKNQTSAEE
ncbi:CheR family methyltransferase [Rhodohalobacter barkolensis]|uniref:Chemotaxis protein CheR n=1 Tax=Rhodohalobacter barkolensis TaxID=2053187 RepID=A0A2N0VE76_9BACT|nr:CheR family methyltransferase [Rhodohalobacter barkolensis]PKD42501.1 chemotaxis protein CheR [Rhodohalobacter barkolensis]